MTRSLCLYIIVLAATLAGSLPAPVLANDRDLRATTVPAALCVEGGSNDVVWVWLNEREYGIRGKVVLNREMQICVCTALSR